MIFLEQTVEQIVNEEGQLILSLADLGITWEKLEKLFIGTYEQSKGYLSIYDWETHMINQHLEKYDGISHIRHMTYTTGYLQRYMPDMPSNYWEYNPYTQKAASLMNTNFSLEVGKYPTCSTLEYTVTLDNVKKNSKQAFSLPFVPSSVTAQATDDLGAITDLDINSKEVTYDNAEDYDNTYLTMNCHCVCDSEDKVTEVQFTGDATGNFDLSTYSGTLKFNKDYHSVSLTFTTKYVGIKELDLTCELFYTWFKANMLTMIGRVKKQIDMSNSGMPFDLGQDGLLERANELTAKVEELKGTKSHWSNF